MPRIYHRMEETGYHILNPICEQIVNGLLDKIDALKYMQNSVYILHSMSSYSSSNDRQGGINLTKDRCDVEARFILDGQNVPWPDLSPYTTPAYGMRRDFNGNHRAIFEDTDAMVRLEEYTTPAAIDMDVTLTFQTFDATMRCFDMIKLLNVGTVCDANFDLSYGYPLTMSMNEMLYAVYQARQDYKGKDYIQYLRDYQKNPINFDIRKQQLTADRADTELMVRCQQLMCQGQLTFDQSEPQVIRKDNLPDKYILNFNYKVQFGRPTMVVGIVPVSVDNSFLPFKLFERDATCGNQYVGGKFQDPWMDPGILMNYKNYVLTNQLIRFPEYDDWIINDSLINTFKFKPFIIGCFTLDLPGPTTIDLMNMSGVTFDPIAVDILKQEGSAVFDFQSLFNVSVIADGIRIDSSLLSIDENLVVTINADEPRAHYYLVISETTDFTYLSSKWYDLLLKYRYFFPMSIMRNLDFLCQQKLFTVTTTNDLISLIEETVASGGMGQILYSMMQDGDTTGKIFQYVSNAAQFADYITNTPALNKNPTIPDPTTPGNEQANTYLTTMVDANNRSLFNAFITKLLQQEVITVDDVPEEYYKTAQGYPYVKTQGDYNGIGTPLRVLKYQYRWK